MRPRFPKAKLSNGGCLMTPHSRKSGGSRNSDSPGDLGVGQNYCSQNGVYLQRESYYNRNPNTGARIRVSACCKRVASGS